MQQPQEGYEQNLQSLRRNGCQRSRFSRCCGPRLKFGVAARCILICGSEFPRLCESKSEEVYMEDML